MLFFVILHSEQISFSLTCSLTVTELINCSLAALTYVGGVLIPKLNAFSTFLTYLLPAFLTLIFKTETNCLQTTRPRKENLPSSGMQQAAERGTPSLRSQGVGELCLPPSSWNAFLFCLLMTSRALWRKALEDLQLEPLNCSCCQLSGSPWTLPPRMALKATHCEVGIESLIIVWPLACSQIGCWLTSVTYINDSQTWCFLMSDLKSRKHSKGKLERGRRWSQSKMCTEQ